MKMKSNETKDILRSADADQLKDQGNKYFASRKYNDAISAYTKAIEKCSEVPTYYTNRALCYIKQQSWETATHDCKKALDIDQNSLKGHFFMGQSLLELGQFDECIKFLTTAHELSKEQKAMYGDEITAYVRRAKKLRWNRQEEKRMKQEIELQEYLNRLMREDKERRLGEVEASGENSQADETEKKHTQNVEELNNLFKKVDDRRKARDVPDYLCGQISFEIMRDPVITPSGVTYKRKNIEEHLQRVGHFDPVTRKELTCDMLIPNLAMKDVIDSYLEQNPWAEDY